MALGDATVACGLVVAAAWCYWSLVKWVASRVEPDDDPNGWHQHQDDWWDDR